jgi:hypothetical protein
MLTNEQRTAVAKYGNDWLVKLFTEFLQGYPDLEKKTGRTLDPDMKLWHLTGNFRSVLQQINQRDATILTDPKMRVILLDASRISRNNLPTWNAALKDAEVTMAFNPFQGMS